MNVVGAIILCFCVMGLMAIAIGKWLAGIREFYEEVDDNDDGQYP